MSHNLYIASGKIFLYPRKSHWFWGSQPKDYQVSQSDLVQYKQKDLKSLKPGDFVMATSMKPWMMEIIYKGYEAQAMSDTESLIAILAFLNEEFEEEFKVVHKLVSLHGSGARGTIVTSPFLKTVTDSKKIILTPLVLKNGRTEQRRSLSQFQTDFNINAWATAAIYVINLAGEGIKIMLSAMSPTSKASILKDVSGWALDKLKDKVEKEIKRKFIVWLAKFAATLAKDVALNLAKDLYAEGKKNRQERMAGIHAKRETINAIVERSIKTTLVSSISKELSGLILKPVEKMLPDDAERALSEKIAQYMSMKLIERCINLTTETITNIILQIPVGDNELTYQKELQKGIEESVKNLLKSPLEDIIQDAWKAMTEDGF